MAQEELEREIDELKAVCNEKQAEIDQLNKVINNEEEEGSKYVAFKLKAPEPVVEAKIAPGKFSFLSKKPVVDKEQEKKDKELLEIEEKQDKKEQSIRDKRDQYKNQLNESKIQLRRINNEIFGLEAKAKQMRELEVEIPEKTSLLEKEQEKTAGLDNKKSAHQRNLTKQSKQNKEKE